MALNPDQKSDAEDFAEVLSKSVCEWREIFEDGCIGALLYHLAQEILYETVEKNSESFLELSKLLTNQFLTKIYHENR